MKKKLFSKKIAIVLALTAAFAIGIFGGTVFAAGSYHTFAPRSYGTFTYDDGNASNNNGHDHDFMIDTSDLVNISDNVDSLANTTDEINNIISTFPEFIYDADGRITGYKSKDGADTVFPFIKEPDYSYGNISGRFVSKTFNGTVSDIEPGRDKTVFVGTTESLFGSGYTIVGISYLTCTRNSFSQVTVASASNRDGVSLNFHNISDNISSSNYSITVIAYK